MISETVFFADVTKEARENELFVCSFGIERIEKGGSGSVTKEESFVLAQVLPCNGACQFLSSMGKVLDKNVTLNLELFASGGLSVCSSEEA